MFDVSFIFGEQPSTTKWNYIDANFETLDARTQLGWVIGVLPAPDTITALGNRSYSVVFNSVDLTQTLTPGAALRAIRTVTAPTQCADLESGSTQYFSKSSPAGMTFTDDFAVSAWVKLESYASQYIASRWNGTSGWGLLVASDGRVQLFGTNGGSGNSSWVITRQSLPLGRWVHVAAQLDMSAFSASATESYIMLDGVDVPVVVDRSGTNPTALVQAGNLEIGSTNGGTSPFDGKIAQVALYSAKVTQANMLARMNQTLAGNESNLISAYTLSNSVTDLNTTNANNLTANNSAATTDTDSPFANRASLASGVTAGTTDYGVVMDCTFSTNTTVTVQVPEGCTLPTSGGISAMAFSAMTRPFGFPVSADRWEIKALFKIEVNQGSATQNQWYNIGAKRVTIPIGCWQVEYTLALGTSDNSSDRIDVQATLSTANNTQSDTEFTSNSSGNTGGATSQFYANTVYRSKNTKLSAQTSYYLNTRTTQGSAPTIYNLDQDDFNNCLIIARPRFI